MTVPACSCAPVAGAEGGEVEAVDGCGGVPGEFGDVGEATGDEFACGGGGDDAGARVGEGFEGGFVEVVEVGVADEDEVDGGELVDERGVGEAARAEDEGPEADADLGAEDGVGEDGLAVQAEEDGAVPEPGEGGEA